MEYMEYFGVITHLKLLVHGLFHLLIDGIYWGYNPLTNQLMEEIRLLGGWSHDL